MKKIFILSLLISLCNPTYLTYAQKQKSKSTPEKQKPKTNAEKLEDAWAQLKKSKDTTAILITDIKDLATQKVIYRTKLVEHIDTVWRIDTCISIITAVDSATIAIMFKNREVPKRTAVGKVIRFIFYKKKKS